METPVRFLRKSSKYDRYYFSVPKSCIQKAVDNKSLIVGKKYIVKVKEYLNHKPVKESVKQKKPRKGIPICISMNRDFAEEVIDKEFLCLGEMLRENMVDELAEVTEYIMMNYNFDTGELRMENEEVL